MRLQRPHEVKRTRDAGFAMHITKPVDFERLAEAILEQLKR
jgi:hypothetical protein